MANAAPKDTGAGVGAYVPDHPQRPSDVGRQTLSPADIWKLVHSPFVVDRPRERPWNATIATAIALAESGGDTGAQNPTGATGLFQIMPATARGLGRDPGQLFDPTYNARTAYLLWQASKGWTDWQTYTQGTYRQQLATAREHKGKTTLDSASGTGVLGTGVGPDVLPNASESALNPLKWPGLLADLLKTLQSKHFWLRAGMVVGGLILIVLAVVVFGRQFLMGVRRTVK